MSHDTERLELADDEVPKSLPKFFRSMLGLAKDPGEAQRQNFSGVDGNPIHSAQLDDLTLRQSQLDRPVAHPGVPSDCARRA